MKKIYFLAASLLFAGVANAQFEDDMESYPLGDIGDANTAIWNTWSGNPNSSSEDLDIVDTFANSGTKSGFIGGDNVQDVMLQLGNKTSGTWSLEFKLYIPNGKTGYFNLQGETAPTGGAAGGSGSFNSPNLVWNNTQSASGAPGTAGAYGNINDAEALYEWSYLQDFWNTVKIVFDLDAGTWQMNVNGSDIPAQPLDEENVAGAIDFFSIDENNEYYLDDFKYVEGLLSTNEFSADVFSVYPNPVVNTLNIKSANPVQNITVYDVLGKQVLVAQPDAISPSVDMSRLPSGAYLVNVTINGTSKTIKVLK